MATLFMNTILGDNSVDVITQSELLAINDEASHARQWRLAARSSETEHFPSGFFPASDQLSTSAYQEKIEDYISTIINQTQLLQARQKIEQLENRLNESDRRTAELENQLEQMQRRLDQIYSRLPQLGPSDGDRLTIESQKSLHSVEVHPSIPSARQQ